MIISDDIKDAHVSWLGETIRKRVDVIVSNQHCGFYSKAAFLVCTLDECLENLKM